MPCLRLQRPRTGTGPGRHHRRPPVRAVPRLVRSPAGQGRAHRDRPRTRPAPGTRGNRLHLAGSRPSPRHPPGRAGCGGDRAGQRAHRRHRQGGRLVDPPRPERAHRARRRRPRGNQLPDPVARPDHGARVPDHRPGRRLRPHPAAARLLRRAHRRRRRRRTRGADHRDRRAAAAAGHPRRDAAGRHAPRRRMAVHLRP